MKNCVACSREINQEKSICGYCGSRQPEVTSQTNMFAAAEAAPAQQPKAKKSRKGLFIGLGAAVLVAVAAVLAFLLLTPKGLEAKDVTSNLLIQDTGAEWAGDGVTIVATMTLTKVQDDEYRVVIEQLSGNSTTWTEISEQSGFGPAFVFTEQAVLGEGTNQFRMSIYNRAKGTLITRTKVQETSTLVATLPFKCPVDKFNTDPSMVPFELSSSPVENGIDCSMYVPNSDYFVPLVYTKVTPEEWEASMKADGGREVTIGYGTTAYAFTKPATELSTEFEVIVVNFHGIKIYSELSEEGIAIAIEAIPRAVL